MHVDASTYIAYKPQKRILK